MGKRLLCFDTTSSTIEEAWREVGCEIECCGNPIGADGLVVATEFQTAGRGRRGRTWHSPRGAAILCSAVLVDAGSHEPYGNGDAHRAMMGARLVLATAVAATEAIETEAGVSATIKWPNDLLVRGRKVGGILIESRRCPPGANVYVVGIGINCLQHRGHFPEEIIERATSLELESTHSIHRELVLIALLERMDRWLTGEVVDDELRLRWLERSGLVGRNITIQQGDRFHSGQVIDLTPDACLLLQLEEGDLRRFHPAEASLVHSPATGISPHDSAASRA